MTTQEFQRLVDRAAPSEWLRLDWGQYDTEAFAAAFLPQVNVRFPDERLRLVNAGELFASSIVREVGRAAPAQGEQELFVMTVHTMPEGVPAVANTSKLAVADDELLVRFIVRQDDTVRVEFELGRNVQKVLRQLKKGDAVPAQLVMNSTVAELDKYARAGFDRRVVTRLLLGALGLADILADEFTAPSGPPEAPFSAGSYRSKGKKGWAHGDIEEEALASVGYSTLERQQVYYGNWLRDYSQIIVGVTQGFSPKDAATLKDLAIGGEYGNLAKPFSTSGLQNRLTQAQWLGVMEILAVHEFAFKRDKVDSTPTKSYEFYKADFDSNYGRLDADRLGVYRPEEHLDNPKGLKDESIYGDKNLTHRVEYRHGLPSDVDHPMRTLFAGLPEENERKVDGTGPLDIDGAENMKNFLLHDIHGIADAYGIEASRPSPMTYFADQLKLAAQKRRSKDGLRHLGAALHVLEDYYAHSNFVEIALIKVGEHKVWPWVKMTPEVEQMTDGAAKAQLIPLTTGYFSTADTLASVAPKVAEVFFEPEDPQKPYVPKKPGHRSFAEEFVLFYLRAMSVNEAVLKEEDRTTYAGLTYAKLLSIFLLVLEQRDKYRKEMNEPDLLGKLLRGFDRTLGVVGSAISFFPKLIITLLLNSTTEFIGALQTYVGQPLNDDPSHTQLAKDPPEHHLNGLAGELAVVAVGDVGKRIKECWNGAPVESLIQHVRARYFKHPTQTDWMDERVKQWAEQHKAEVARAASKSTIEHHEKELETFTEETLPSAIKYYKDLMGL